MYAKDEDAEIDTLRTYHKNDEEETEVDKEDIVEGQWVSVWWEFRGVKCGEITKSNSSLRRFTALIANQYGKH